jgi:hypothetical protein
VTAQHSNDRQLRVNEMKRTAISRTLHPTNRIPYLLHLFLLLPVG